MNDLINKKIKIIFLDDELQGNKYNGREGIVTHIDDIGQLHGTWGGLAIIPDIDQFIVME